jgi:hypothetical protein
MEVVVIAALWFAVGAILAKPYSFLVSVPEQYFWYVVLLLPLAMAICLGAWLYDSYRNWWKNFLALCFTTIFFLPFAMNWGSRLLANYGWEVTALWCYDLRGWVPLACFLLIVLVLVVRKVFQLIKK